MPPEFLPTHHRSLRLQNFTAFADATFEFVPGVNVLVGENGTGKTHVLKALYALSRFQRNAFKPSQYLWFLTGLFAGNDARLLRWNASSGEINDSRTVVHLKDVDVPSGTPRGLFFQGTPVFLTATDMIGHTKGFLAIEREFPLDFDRTYGDIVSKLELDHREERTIAVSEMQVLEKQMGGTVEFDFESERFYLVTPEGRIAMPLVAEGLRKFATLHTIWKNGWLRPGTCLFWDEPEANLNPKLMDEIVAAILALARGGVQVFLATHSYVILKELEVKTTADDAVRFFALEKTEGGTMVHPADRYLDLKPNLIEDQYASLFERTVERRLREQAERV